MKLDIDPIFVSGFNCLENSIHSILKWKSIAYERAFVDSWGFSLNHNKDFTLLGEQLNTITLAETAERYIKYCGMTYTVFKKGSVKDPLTLIKTEIAMKMPMLLGIDIFHCPWVREQYHKQHSLHFCVIIGVDDDYIYCIDPNMHVRDARMPKEEFLDHNKAVCTLAFHDGNSDFSDLKSNLKDCIEGLGLSSKDDNTFENLRCFAGSLEKAGLDKEAQDFDNIWHVPLYTGIVRIYGSRFQTKSYMELLQNYFDDEILPYIIDRFSEILVQWALIQTLTSKALVSKNETVLSHISNRIRRVTDLEENLAETINDFIHDKPLPMIENIKEDRPIQNFLFVDLAGLYNHKYFEKKKADLCGTDRFFSPEGLPAAPVWTADNMQFSFPEVMDAEFDNISCRGQIIQCRSGSFSYIMLIYCSECGSIVDHIAIGYQDGTKELVECAVSGWYGEPEFQETVIWSGKVTSNSNTTEKCNLYAKAIKINQAKKVVTSIKLPDFANIHIFSITLA